MNVLTVYARIYAESLSKALSVIGKNLWTLLLPVGVFIASLFAGTLLAPLGLVGGFILGFLISALYGSYLYFVSGLVTSGRVLLSEIKGSFGGLLWPVIGVGFVVWIAEWVVGALVSGMPNGGTLMLLFNLLVALLVLVNPTPEVIYDRGSSSGMATLQRSFQFVQENWIEWYVPNLLLGVAAYYLWRFGAGLGGVGSIVAMIALAAFFHVAMVFRGFLYKTLDGSSHRQRMFKFRGGM